MSASHHLFSFTPDHSLLRFSYGGSENQANHFTVPELKKLSKNFSIYIDLWKYSKTRSRFKTKEGKMVKQVFDALDNKETISNETLRILTMILMHSGPGGCMREFQRHIDHFKSYLPEQYRAIIPKFDFKLESRDELIFHNCKPDLYLWMPKENFASSRVIVVYPTKNNTLNMPLSLAHFILSRLNINLLYIFNRPEKRPNEFVANYRLSKSIKLIKSVLDEFKLTEIMGIGVSLGGYKICQLAYSLDMQGVLNFSGNIFHDNSNNKEMAPLFNPKNMLSVLSSKDSFDINLLNAYKKHHFNTLIDFTDFNSHGTFTSAFLEGKLDGYFNWLLERKSNSSANKFSPLDF